MKLLKIGLGAAVPVLGFYLWDKYGEQVIDKFTEVKKKSNSLKNKSKNTH